MISAVKRFGLVAAGAVAVVAMATGPAFASVTVSPSSTAFTDTNSGSVTFAGTIDGLPITITCTGSVIKATTPPAGSATFTVTTDPTFTGCSDGATITSSGTWGLVAVSSTELQLSVPTGGAKFTSSVLPGCTITAKSATLNGAYNGTNTSTFTKQSVGVSASGCTASSTSFTGTYKSNITITVS